MGTTSAASGTSEGTEPTTRVATGARAPSLTPQAGAILLRLARSAVAATTSDRVSIDDLEALLPSDPPGVLLEPGRAFVTLHLDGELRGCVGYIESDRPLWETVVSAAVGAAAGDPRFRPVTGREVASLAIDVSVLGPAVPLVDLATFRPGSDGMIVERGRRRGLLLPDVASEHGWGVGEMLAATCWKAGLPADAWRDPGTRAFVFRATRVSDSPSPRVSR
jgi:AmmeMemoRadiSam system protein A